MSYPNSKSASARLYERARGVLPDGGSRSSIRMLPYPLYLASAHGKHVIDVDGNEYVDFNNNFTSLIHGHSHPVIVDAVNAQLTRGSAYSFLNESEIELAELLCGRVGGFDRIRFMNSGTEAVMNAVKAARAYTNRAAIAKCENAYHGTFDAVEVSLGVAPTVLADGDPVSVPGAPGTPRGVTDDVVVIPLNETAAAERILTANAERLAAVLIDPFGVGMGRTLPSDDFLAMLARFCRRHGVLLVLDEVVSFRAGFEGSQGARQIPADLTALGKIIGGGFPVGAVAGRADVMAVFADGADGSPAALHHAGTFNANPVTMVAGLAAMTLMTEGEFDRINALGDAFRAGVAEVLELTNTPGEGAGHYSIFTVVMDDPELATPRERNVAPASSGLHRYLLNHGYFLSPGMMGVISTVMDTSDVDPFCQTLLDGIRSLKGRA
ncbi:MAG: aminotransferase class III-fold pyridoxal phosphate-dependent enzyme [Gammaproteobacteria bacterium]